MVSIYSTLLPKRFKKAENVYKESNEKLQNVISAYSSKFAIIIIIVIYTKCSSDQ